MGIVRRRLSEGELSKEVWIAMSRIMVRACAGQVVSCHFRIIPLVIDQLLKRNFFSFLSTSLENNL